MNEFSLQLIKLHQYRPTAMIWNATLVVTVLKLVVMPTASVHPPVHLMYHQCQFVVAMVKHTQTSVNYVCMPVAIRRTL